MPEKSKSSRAKEKNTSNINKIIVGSVIGSVFLFMLILLFSFLVLKTDSFSSSLYLPAGLVFGAMSAFVGGFVSVRPIRKNGALFGTLTGLAQALICSASMFFINGNNAGSGLFILMAVITAFGSIGGISAVNLKVRKRY